MTTDDVIDALKAACADAGGIRAWARRHQVSATYVSDILRGKREPAGKVLKALRIVRKEETAVWYELERS